MAGTGFYTLKPCRLIDTRGATGPLGGPSIAGMSVRLFAVGGTCGIPTNARSIAANVTVVNPAVPGDLRIYRGDIGAPLASSINFIQSRSRANNLLVALSLDGRATLAIQNDASGPVNVVLDISGYFR